MDDKVIKKLERSLKDIELKEGDLIITKDGIRRWVVNNPAFSVFKTEKPQNINFIDEITKIERPVKYETIYEAPKQILEKKEKEYFEAVCRPFKDRVMNICKCRYNDYEWIFFCIEDEDSGDVDNGFSLPAFKKNTMYKGMAADKNYTPKELRLFE